MKKYLAAAAGIFAGAALMFAAAPAMARTNVEFSIGIPGPAVIAAPAPVYVQPQPVYVQPQPVYVQPQPVYVQPRPVYVQPQPVYYARPHGWYGPRWRGEGWRDYDRDGVPNRFDHHPNNPYRR